MTFLLMFPYIFVSLLTGKVPRNLKITTISASQGFPVMPDEALTAAEAVATEFDDENDDKEVRRIPTKTLKLGDREFKPFDWTRK